MHEKASVLKPLWSPGYIEMLAPLWTTHPNEEQSCQLPSSCFSVFKFHPSLSLLCSPYNWDMLNNSQYESLNNNTIKRPIHVARIKSLAISPPLLSYTKPREQESVGIIFFWYPSCVDRRVWSWGKWNTHHSRFMDQRWHLHSVSTAHCRCGVLGDGRGRCWKLKCALS